MVTAISDNQSIWLPKPAKIQCHDIILGATPEYGVFMNDIGVACIQIFPSQKEQRERQREG